MGRRSYDIGAANERGVLDFYKKRGCTVHRIGRPGIPAGKRQRRGTMQSRGLPDFLVFHEPSGRMWGHEAKAGKATLSADQRAFRDQAARCGLTVVVGTWEDGAKHMEQLGLLRLELLDSGRIVRILTA